MRSGAVMTRAGFPAKTLRSYTTDFPGTEDPLSEGGNFVNGGDVGLDWHNMQSAAHKCWGQQNQSAPTGTTRDGTALLTGLWSPNQAAQATTYVTALTNTSFPEVELRLRSSMSANVNIGYEVAWSCLTGASPYFIIVRWNGPIGHFDYIFNDSGLGWGTVDGDVLSASIVGNIIIAKKNGITIKTVDVSSIGGTVWSSGNPGLGHNAEETGGAHNSQYGFSAFSATEL